MPDLKSIPVLHDMTRERFEAEVVPAGRPVVLKGLVNGWPAVAAGRKSPADLAAYLGRFDSGAPVKVSVGDPAMQGRFTYADDMKRFNYDQREMPLAELIQRLMTGQADSTAPHLNAGAVPEPVVLPGLAGDNPMPLLEAGRERLTSLWIGNRSRTAAHWDLPQNLACVVAGRRRFTLFPIDQVANLYVGPLDFTPAGQAISLVDINNPDFDRHPRFREALAHAEVAELEPGDALYMPSLWWHHVETLGDFGAMVNLWWRDGPDYMATPMLTLFHALLTLRDLPENERASWRVLFDHYIFQTGEGDPMAHVPVEVRGVFAPMTPGIMQRLKAFLSRPLLR